MSKPLQNLIFFLSYLYIVHELEVFGEGLQVLIETRAGRVGRSAFRERVASVLHRLTWCIRSVTSIRRMSLYSYTFQV